METGWGACAAEEHGSSPAFPVWNEYTGGQPLSCRRGSDVPTAPVELMTADMG